LVSSDFVVLPAINSMTGASGRQRADRGFIVNLKILIPPLPTQQKIADILSAYDDLIENNNSRIELLEKVAQNLYKEWFARFRFPNYKETKFENGLPLGWKIFKLSELVETQYGYTASAESENGGPKFLRITDIAQKNLNWGNVPYCKIEEKELLKYLLEEGDILVARTGATVGYAKRINKNSPQAIFASFLVRLKPKNKKLGLMIGMVVESEQYKSFIQAIATGAAQPQANAQLLTLFSMIVPDDNLVNSFNSIVEPINDQIENLLMKNRNLIKQRDLLLPRLMSGKLEV
ncbi:MAG: restriction endonuclease subunit S, partial [Bacillota bacterium]|nr:restriction endonuclease subunit S [Bacillota bacterium]